MVSPRVAEAIPGRHASPQPSVRMIGPAFLRTVWIVSEFNYYYYYYYCHSTPKAECLSSLTGQGCRWAQSFGAYGVQGLRLSVDLGVSENRGP